MKYECHVNAETLFVRITDGEGTDFRALSFRVDNDDFSVTKLSGKERVFLTKSFDGVAAYDQLRFTVRELSESIKKSDLLYHVLMELMLRVCEVQLKRDGHEEEVQ